MKNKALKVMLTIFILMVIFIASLYFLREPICKGKLLKSTRMFTHLFFPPKDLYKTLVNEEINIGETEIVQSYEFKTKYIGPHAVYVVFEGMPFDFAKSHELKLEINFDFYKNDLLLTSKNTKNFNNKSWKLHNYIWCIFNVPDEIPLDQNIICKITITTTDELLAKNIEGTRIIISKMSEL